VVKSLHKGVKGVMRPLLLLSMMLLAACQRGPDAAQQARAQANLRPVLVELFTSQGCSSCPPADRFLDQLSHEPAIVAISRPVTSWDRFGWRDTLAREQNTDLQRRYAIRHREDGYTPQAVVQGRVMLIGGREGAVHRAIDEYRAASGAAPQLRVDGQTLILDGTTAQPAEIRLLALRGRVTVPIGRGENSGRTVDYVNVVVDETSLGTWRGGPLRLPIPAARLHAAGADRYAVVVQEPNAGQVLTASFL
jgi:hypothetical protein